MPMIQTSLLVALRPFGKHPRGEILMQKPRRFKPEVMRWFYFRRTRIHQ